LHLRAVVASLDGSQLLRREASQPVESADALGASVAAGLLEDGAGPILQAAQDSATQETGDT
jgi:hydroxymethylbilane synthase